MPIYEYRCPECKKISTFLSLRVSETIEPYCKFCGSKRVEKMISRVAILKSEEKRIESMLDPAKFSDLDENNPRSVERFMRRIGKEFGDELGEDFEETIEEALSEAQSSKESKEEEDQ
ncbi:MAG: zinc ribbon domain-containing protein [Desulfobacterota bacterium]|nr:zinc ribbon domain-containing protein [Thermodesulfobacteriota bacterium]MDW8002427.1 zinc ribbon domain-containing protein [Deltaproteobacteria bacterium]